MNFMIVRLDFVVSIQRNVKNFCPNKNAYKLKGFLSALYFESEHFETNFDEAKLYTSIENRFFKFQIIFS